LRSTWLILPFIFGVFIHLGSVRAAEIETPTVAREALEKDPELAKAFSAGQALWENGNWAESAMVWQALFEKARGRYGDGHITTELAAFYLGDTYHQQRLYTRALPLLERAARAHQRLVGNHASTALRLNNLALNYSALARHDKALPLQQRAFAIYEKVLGPEYPNTATSLNNLAETYRALAQHDKALPLQQRALAIYEKVLGPEHSNTATSLNNLAEIYRALAQYDKALPLQNRTLAIREKVLGSEHPDTARSLGNLASTYLQLAQHDKALPLQQRALAIREKVLGPEHPSTATSLGNLAEIYRALAQYDKALPLQNRTLAIREKVLGPEHPDIATSLGNLAATYSALAQHEKALPLQKRTFAIYEKVFGSEHPSTARSLANLAPTYGALNQHDKALPLHKRALAIREKVLGPEHPDTALSLNNLAFTYVKLAQHDKARPLHQRTLAIYEKVLGPEHPSTATSLNNLAETYRSLAQYDEALPLQQRALAIREKVLGPEHPDTALSLNNLASIYLEMGQPEAAIIFLKTSINIYQNQRQRVSSIGSTELQSYTQSISAAYQVLASTLTDQGRLAEAQLVLDMLKENEQFDFIRRSETADPRRSRIGYNATEQAWVTRYRQIADRLAALGAEEQDLQKQAKLGLTPEQKQRLQALAADLAVARKAFDSFLAELRDGFARQGPARAVEVVETSQQALRETQALLKGLGNDVVLLQYYLTEDKVGMLLTTPGVQLARTSKVSAKELNRLIAEFRRLLRDPKANAQPTAQALYQLLVAPVAQDLEQAGAKTVMLSLDGSLRYLPFAALHDGKQYLVERWNLPIYTSVTKGKLRDAVTPQWQAAGLGLTKEIGGFKALPAVKGEMSSIVKGGNSGVLPGEVYLDEAFNALRLKDVAQRKFQLLHIASHFQFSPGTEVNSFLLLGDGQQLTLGDIRTQNYRFDNVDLLTLSACDTGLGGGRDTNGREIEGFGVIAQQQGAKAVLATLWPVADQSTAELMAEMYRRRQEKNLTKIEALRQAQISLMSQPKYAHPFYWAPFILMGNWK
jgi:CHAT domain-containing protein